MAQVYEQLTKDQLAKERQQFEAYWRVTNGETAYSVGKRLGVATGTIIRWLNGDKRPGRSALSFAQRLSSDVEFKRRYDQYVREQSGDWGSFLTSPLTQEWRKTKSGRTFFVLFTKICQGSVLKEFRVNPTIHEDPQTKARWSKFDKDKVKEFVELYREEKGLDEDNILPPHFRRCLRSWILDGLKQNLTESEGEQLGISGEKADFGAYADQYMTDEEIDRAYDILPEIAPQFSLYPEEAVADFALRLEWFGRPKRITLMKTDQPRIKVDAESGREVVYTEAFWETKTSRFFPKAMIDPRGIAAVKVWLDRRKRERKQYFGLDDEAWQKRTNVLSLLYRELYRRLGRTETYDKLNTDGTINKASYWFKRPLYIMRHSGAHLWLRRRYKETGTWDFAFVAGMGWDDISTLAKCYGAMPPEVIMHGISRALAALPGLPVTPGVRP